MNWLVPSEFNWEEAPLNKFWHAGTAVAVYLCLIFGIEEYVKRRGGFSRKTLQYLRYWQMAHNLFLSIGSLIMVLSACYLAVVYKLGRYPDDPDSGTEFLTCTRSDPPSSGRLFYWVYIFYVSKYVELLDTVIQMLKGNRPPSFYFHIWHHTAYLLICYGYNARRSSLSYLAVIINGSVHIIMYYYYYVISSGRKSIWWKPLITQVQIIQFIAGYGFFAINIKKTYIDKQPCNGKGVLAIHALFNMTMLIGFVKILARIKSTHFIKIGATAKVQ